MIAEIGHDALVLVVFIASIPAIGPLFGAWRSDPALIASAQPEALVQVSPVEPSGGGRSAARLYHHPLVPRIWIGAWTMLAGGCLPLSNRHYRVDAPNSQRCAFRPPPLPLLFPPRNDWRVT